MTENTVNEAIVLTKYPNYINLRLVGDLNADHAGQFIMDYLPEITNYNLDLIINCNYLTKLSQEWLRALTVVDQTLRKSNKSLRLVLVREDIKNIFNDKGLSRTLIINNNLRDALLSLKLICNKSLDVGFINPFLEATLYVLKEQAQIEARAGKIYLKKDFNELSGDISGVIGLVSDSFNGNVIISFPEKTFLNLLLKMFRVTFTEIDQENANGAAEITNMIFGQAKITLNKEGYGIKTALPTLIIGRNHRVSTNKQELIVVVPFETDIGNFYVEISLSDN